MANEITISGSLAYSKGQIGSESLAVSNKNFDVAGANFIKTTQTIPTTAGGTAINKGALSNLGFFFIKNNDQANYVTILNATSGTSFLRIGPGLFAQGYFDPGVTAPAALANVASVQIEYEFVEI